MIPELGLAPFVAQPRFLALLAIGAVWLVVGWSVYRTSRRAARLWAAAALVALAAANVVEIVRSEGPWWPLIDRAWSVLDWLAVIDWIAALVLIFRARQRGRQAGLAILSCAIAAFAFGLVAAETGHSSHSGSLCLGQSRSIGPWTAALRAIKPVADKEYTGVQAELSLRSGNGRMVEAHPEQRNYIVGGHSPHAGSDTLLRWNGELLVESRSSRANPDCIAVKLEWRPLAQWLRYGAWLSLVGAALLFAAACHSAWWRAAAWERIAMRREDRTRRTVPAVYRRPAWQPVAIALALGLIGFAWQAGPRPLHDPIASGKRAAVDGPAMIAARQSLFGGPHLDNRWIVIADALVRHGQFGDAAQILQGAVEKEPDNAEAWLAMGDALYGHARGGMVPAAELAYDRADRAAAREGNAAMLAGTAMARSGRIEDARYWFGRRPSVHQPGAP